VLREPFVRLSGVGVVLRYALSPAIRQAVVSKELAEVLAAATTALVRMHV